MGQVKFGECVGEDRHGNRYFENRNYLYGEKLEISFQSQF